MPHDIFPQDLPEPPLQRFYIEGMVQEYPAEIVWVDAASAVEAAHMAEILWTPFWGRFTRIEWISAETGEPLRLHLDLDAALRDLDERVKAQDAGRGE